MANFEINNLEKKKVSNPSLVKKRCILEFMRFQGIADLNTIQETKIPHLALIAAGGLGLLIDEQYKDYEILSDASIFIPNVYESIWVKIKIENGPDKIIGNVYRPNSAPLANLSRAIEVHNDILDKLQKDINHSKCEIQVVGDFNINMLNFETHSLTNDYINSQISKSFIPLITLPTTIKHQSATFIDHIWSKNIQLVF